MAPQIATIDHALDAAQNLVKALELLKRQLETSPAMPNALWIKPNGRLTDAGVHAMQLMFQDKKVTDAEIARRFKVTPSAVAKQRSNYLTSAE